MLDCALLCVNEVSRYRCHGCWCTKAFTVLFALWESRAPDPALSLKFDVCLIYNIVFFCPLNLNAQHCVCWAHLDEFKNHYTQPVQNTMKQVWRGISCSFFFLCSNGFIKKNNLWYDYEWHSFCNHLFVCKMLTCPLIIQSTFTCYTFIVFSGFQFHPSR